MIQTYDPGFSDLYQLTHILVRESQGRYRQTTTVWLQPLDDIHRKDIRVAVPATQVAQAPHESVPWDFPHLLPGEKFILLHKDLMKLFMIITHTYSKHSGKTLGYLLGQTVFKPSLIQSLLGD